MKRVWEHKKDIVDGFSKQYQTHILVYFELFPNIESAIIREKRLKKMGEGLENKNH